MRDDKKEDTKGDWMKGLTSANNFCVAMRSMVLFKRAELCIIFVRRGCRLRYWCNQAARIITHSSKGKEGKEWRVHTNVSRSSANNNNEKFKKTQRIARIAVPCAAPAHTLRLANIDVA